LPASSPNCAVKSDIFTSVIVPVYARVNERTLPPELLFNGMTASIKYDCPASSGSIKCGSSEIRVELVLVVSDDFVACCSIAVPVTVPEAPEYPETPEYPEMPENAPEYPDAPDVPD